MMFYVIGSEESKSGSAFYSTRQQNQQHGEAVRHFWYAGTVSDKLTCGGMLVFRCLYSRSSLCHHDTDNVLYRQIAKGSHYIRTTKYVNQQL